METSDNERAKSFTRVTIWLPLTPTAGSISERVITGPGYAAATLTSTPKSWSFFSISRDVNSSVSALIASCAGGGASSSDRDGRLMLGQRALLLLLRVSGFLDLRHRGHDLNGFMRFHAHPVLFKRGLALARRRCARFTVAPCAIAALNKVEDCKQGAADALGHIQP